MAEEDRLGYLKSLAAKLDRQKKQYEDFSTRLEFPKALTVDKEDANAANVDCVTHDQRASVEERMDCLEKSLADLADKLKTPQTAHKEHDESMKIRLESLEALIKDDANNCAMEAVAPEVELRDFIDFGKSIVDCDARINCLEKSLTELGDKMTTSQTAHGEREESMKIRLESLEALIESNADLYSKVAEASKEQLKDLGKAIVDCGTRTNCLEKSLAELVDKLKCPQKAHEEHEELTKVHLKSFEALIASQTAHGEHEASMKIRLESLEALIAHNSDKHAKEVAKSLEIWTKLADWIKHNGNQLASVEERMNSLENSLAESADKVKTLRSAHEKKFEHSNILHSSIDQRVERRTPESLDGDSIAEIERLGSASLQCASNPMLRRRQDEEYTRRRLDFEERSPSQTFAILFQDLFLGQHQVKDKQAELQSGSTVDIKFQDLASLEQQTALLEGTPVTPSKAESLSTAVTPSKPESQFESAVMELQDSALLEHSGIVKAGLQPAGELQPSLEDLSLPPCIKVPAISPLPSPPRHSGTIDTLEWLPAHSMESNSHIVGSWSYKGDTFCIRCVTGTSSLLFTQHSFTGELEAIGDWLQVGIPDANGTLRMQINRMGNRLRAQFRRNKESRWRKEVLAERIEGLV